MQSVPGTAPGGGSSMGVSGDVGVGGGGRAPNPEEAERARQRQKAMEEERRLLLKRILTPDASARLSNIALVKPDKARDIENYIIQVAQSGRFGGGTRVSDEQLKGLLEQFAKQDQKTPKITIQRRKNLFDDEDDDEDDW